MASVMNLVKRRPQIAQYRIGVQAGASSFNIRYSTTASGLTASSTLVLNVPNDNVGDVDPYKDFRGQAAFSFNPNVISAGLDSQLFFIQAFPVVNGSQVAPLNMKAVAPYNANPGTLETVSDTAPSATAAYSPGTLAIGTGPSEVFYTAITPVSGNSYGDDYEVAHVTSGDNTPLSVVVTGTYPNMTVTVNLATNANGTAISNVSQVAQAVNGSPLASQFVVATTPTAPGYGVAIAAAAAPLAGGATGSLYVPFSESLTGFSITNTGSAVLSVAFNGSTEELSIAANATYSNSSLVASSMLVRGTGASTTFIATGARNLFPYGKT
jgi:hypothetical protein